MKKELEIKISQLIGLFSYLIYTEDFKAYRRIKSNYEILFENLTQKENIRDEDFVVIQSSLRVFDEAPPKDKALGKYILCKMEEIYELKNKIEKME